MITIETITAIVKKELGLNLKKLDNFYMSKNNVVYVAKSISSEKWFVSLKKETKKNIDLELDDHKLTNEKELKTLIRKFKKIRKLI